MQITQHYKKKNYPGIELQKLSKRSFSNNLLLAGYSFSRSRE